MSIRTLKKLRESKLKNEEYEKQKLINYKNPHEISLVAKIMRQQNLLLINAICDYKKLNKYERQEMIDKFFKVNYYCPEIKKYHKKETNQYTYTF